MRKQHESTPKKKLSTSRESRHSVPKDWETVDLNAEPYSSPYRHYSNIPESLSGSSERALISRRDRPKESH